jgi:hypothetical protein
MSAMPIADDPITIRELDRATDRAGVEAIDTSFETRTVFDLVTAPRGIELVERELARPLTKRYSIWEVFAPWAEWDAGWVADDGTIHGFATAAYEPWHQRLVARDQQRERARRRGVHAARIRAVRRGHAVLRVVHAG